MNQGLSALGRRGDTTMVHIAPSELRGLQALTGLPLTQNPHTGYPEMFSWKKLLAGIGMIAAVPLTGGLSSLGLGALAPAVAPIVGALGAGTALSALQPNKKKEAGSEAARALDERTKARMKDMYKIAEPIRVNSYGIRPSITGEEQVYHVAPAGLGNLGGFAKGGLLEPEEQQARDIVVQYLAAMRGQHQNPDQAESQFIEYYGPQAAQDLRRGGMVKGPGSGMDDMVAADLHGQKALLSNDEFVIPADVVSHIGDGSSSAGARKLEAMMHRVRREKTGTEKQPGKISKKVMPR